MAKYDLYPEIKVNQYSGAWRGYPRIVEEIKKNIRKEKTIIAVESYIGVHNEEIKTNLVDALQPELEIFADDLAFDGDVITEMVKRNLTDDRVFGVMSHQTLDKFYDKGSLYQAGMQIEQAKGLVVIYGTGASLIAEADILIYADLARWECQCRYRAGGTNWKVSNEEEDPLKKNKRGYFFEWRICDRLKDNLYPKIDFLLDTNVPDDPKMISGDDYRYGLSQAVEQPFRLVPYFDASVWGGQWMKEKFQLDPDADNFGWAFDGVPEENSLYLRYGDVRVEVPALNLVHQFPNELLGPRVHSRFGKEFPIRFDFLDTMEGGNLSLQVHPLTEYIQDKFGMHYTQDESYYILDAGEDAAVYLGVKDNIKLNDMVEDLKKAQEKSEYQFPDEKYVNRFPAKKHDHFLIPAGTVHCGGSNVVVLEISATPYIFTFKLWDWGRIGLDGRPRPVHIEHGKENILLERSTEWVKENLINQIQDISENSVHKEERTGLHELEFIETRRHWLKETIELETKGSVNVLNLIEGDAALVESTDGSFEPYEVHYGETFMIPAKLGKYKITPLENETETFLGIIQAYVR
ncbi:class I mannose-6-phosphate isomerase [Anaerostipes butyraticus]|uniref:Mannose-6-phosphate isomerase n=1 Tax=Anaerostipes butyraticus TaxID=645466 RepID=A0A916VBN3_9FIRM|nr:class I mannose-6-phosphate isomerase [Anaerostipes butyraticus]GFO84204.1 mannose-6-phosphate isomerase [Anaerostipes butyraticus]